MKELSIHTGNVAVINKPNIDTDQIIPKQFLKRIEKTGYENFLFYNWRYLDSGAPNPKFELNDTRFNNASILLVSENFGCGSSREHAVWALYDYGIRVIISTSFADIFYQNAFKNSLLPIKVSKRDFTRLKAAVSQVGTTSFTIDLNNQNIIYGKDAKTIYFDIAPDKKTALLKGQDEIDKTFDYIDDIVNYELRREDITFLNDFLRKKVSHEV